LAPRFLNTPLHQPGLNRRMYPFLGLAIVGLVTVKPLTAVAASPELMLALLIGAALTLAPVAPDRAIPAGRGIGSLPVAAGFILASYNLWSSGSAIGVGATVILTLLGCALIVVPWEKIPRWLHAASPIGGLLIAMVLEVQFGSSVLKAFPFVLLPLLMLALYYTSVEFAIGAALAVANIATVAIANPDLPDTGQASLAALTCSSAALSAPCSRAARRLPRRKRRRASCSPTSRSGTSSCRR